jgi:uncharacterized repeat protein (TIGR03803 family)
MEKLSLSKMTFIIFVFCVATAIASPAQSFTTLFSFDWTDGSWPEAGLVQATTGNFYGTASSGDTNNLGTVFTVTPAGTRTTLHSFAGYPTDGSEPMAGLVQGTDGNFYGTTSRGGASSSCGGYGCGTVFKITPARTLTTLHSFDGTDGETPLAGLLQATDGNFYGATANGASNDCLSGCGTIFKITPGGTLTTFHSFDGPDGSHPQAGLVQGTDGNFYGITALGGPCATSGGCGTVFKITPGGTLTTLHSFDSTDGQGPDGLLQATDGNFYGTTRGGGAYDYGTVFKITPTGKLTTLLSFDGPNGQGPNGLMQATDGNFYGTTWGGGAHGYGTVFKITPGGTLTTLHNFDSTDGSYSVAGLLQATDGNFYGTTEDGGAYSSCPGGVTCGTVFKLSVGLGPFVETRPTSGKEGAAIVILGTNLTGATSAKFNGTAAKFTVVSSSEIKTSVPAGATTGSVTVVTPKGTLKSNVVFRVTPQIKSFTPTSGAVGTVVTITGVSLQQTTIVTFGGVKATKFTVVSDTEVEATVPTGAKTGHIAITTSGGTVTSSDTFTVT